MDARTTSPIPVASRIGGFVYAIRNIVTEARKVEAAGRRVRYLNIGDPITFGFETPPHLIEAVDRAMRDWPEWLRAVGRHPGGPRGGRGRVRPAGNAGLARSCGNHVGHVGRDRTGADRARRGGRRRSGPSADLSIVHGCARENRRSSRVLPHRSRTAAGCRMSTTSAAWSRPQTRALVVIDPNNPTGATYPVETRRALVELADRHNFPLLADEVYADLAFDGPVPAIAAGYPDAPVISFSSLSKAYLAPGWRAGWMAVGSTPRMDDALGAIKKLADGRLCATGPMEHAIAAALERRSVAPGGLPRRAAAQGRVDDEPPQRHRRDYGQCRRLPPSTRCREWRCRRARPTRTTSWGSCAQPASSASTVRGSARGPKTGSSASSSLPHPQELSGIYDDIASFTRTFLDAG